jgi:hypothetical protein
MKPRPALIALSVLLLSVGLVVFIRAFLNRHTVYPTHETESAFLKNYAPRSAVEPFESKQFNSQWFYQESAAAGKGFATRQAAFHGKVAIKPAKWMSLMTALNNDVSIQLLRDGAQILSATGDPRDGFHFDYKLGKSYGAVTISPLETDRNPQVPEGCVQAVVDVALSEKWFPKEPGIITVKLSSDMHRPAH